MAKHVSCIAFVFILMCVVCNCKSTYNINEEQISAPSFVECFKKDSILCLNDKVQQLAEYSLDRALGSVVDTFPRASQELARALEASAPVEMGRSLNGGQAEGRSRAKRFLRTLLPIVLAIKVKLATILGIGFLAILLMAKKALMFSVFSGMVSMFYFMKKMMMGKEHNEDLSMSMSNVNPMKGGMPTMVVEPDNGSNITRLVFRTRALSDNNKAEQMAYSAYKL